MFTLYGALAALSLASLLGIAWAVMRRQRIPYGDFIRFALCCIPLSFLGSRLAFCLSNLSYYLETIAMPEMMLHVGDGGASMTGALLGMILSAVVAAKWCKRPVGLLLDAAAFGMPAALIIERLAEPLCDMGWGKYLQSTAFDFMADATGGMHPVFAYEAVVAALIGAAMLLAYRRIKPGSSDLLGCFLVLYGCTQTVLESLRNDGHMKVIHFVRVNQVAAIALAAAVLVWWSIRCVRSGFGREAAVSWLTAAVCIGFGVVQEFAADGDENPYFNLTLVSAILAALLLLACTVWYAVWRKQSKTALAVPLVAAATAVLLLIERTASTGTHRLFFVYGIMAANVYIIGHMAFALRKRAASKE